MNNQNKKARYIIIDIMKIFFAYLIMIHHIYLQYGINNNATRVISFIVGYMVVPYFFVTSGYFLFNKISLHIDAKTSVIKLYAKKIVIMYLIWTVIMIVFRIPEIVSIGTDIREQFIYWGKYIRVVLVIGEYQLWYLIGIIQALIIFAICFKKNRIRTCVIVAAIIYILKIVIECLPTIVTGNFVLENIFQLYNIVFGTTRNGIFVGFVYMVIGCLFTKIKHKKRNSLFISGLVAIPTIIIVSYCFSINGNHILAQILMTISVALLFYSSIQIKTKKNSVVLRDMSTFVYVSHMTIVLILERGIGINNYCVECILAIAVVSVIGLCAIKGSDNIKILRYLY